MFATRYVLTRTTTALAASSVRLAPASRKSRRKHAKKPPTAAMSKSHSSSKKRVEAAAPLAAADAAVDEVERLLAETPIAPSAINQIARTARGTGGMFSAADNTDASAATTAAQKAGKVLSPSSSLDSPASQDDGRTSTTTTTTTSAFTSAPSGLDAASALHFRAVHQATDFTALEQTTTRVGSTHAQLEQIERRRSKPSLVEAESEVGVTERLVPELTRLPALHEVHYGDAVVREVDRSMYFAHQHTKEQRSPLASHKMISSDEKDVTDADGEQRSLRSSQHEQRPPSKTPEASTVVIGDTAYVELSLDGDLSEADFAAFDAETANNNNGSSAAVEGTKMKTNSVEENANSDHQEKQRKFNEPTSAGGTDVSAEENNASSEQKNVNEVPAAAEEEGGAHELDVNDGDGVVDEEDAIAITLTFGTARPWFVPASGVVELEPLTPQDCALLLRFLLHLRQQTEADLVPTLRRALQHAESARENEGAASVKPLSGRQGPLTLADVTRYLDTAPPPVVGFTESLPSPALANTPFQAHTSPDAAAAAAGGKSSGRASHFVPSTPSTPSPAFVFHLYLENVSSQNAIGHLATLFGLPQRCFQPHSAVSKMSCSTVLCAVGENRLRREHLLLLNTLRHPGFVLRVSTIQEVSPDRYSGVKPGSGGMDRKNSSSLGAAVNEADSPSAATTTTTAVTSVTQQLFGELARWQPLYETELLLRRVCNDQTTHSRHSTRQQLEHRLRAVQTLGAICFCANREASLARAATDVLHGFFKSAVLNALQRRKSPAPMQRFLKRPNVATAQHAHHISTDPTVRQVLKNFVQTNGDWHATVVRTPYVWRRRWINALRGLVWNTMASQRLRKGGREVCIGDLVLKPAFRDDVHRRGILTVKAEHVMTVTTEQEAAAASLADVFIPFLRGRFPEHLYAAEATHHPIMTRTNMLALLRAMHAPQLLLGLTDELRLLLDVRADSAPMLFRRLIVRPVAMEFAILEDKPPMKALHYDAARLLSNDRWTASAAVAAAGASKRPLTTASPANVQNENENRPQQQQQQPSLAMPSSVSHLIPPSEVLERTTLGSRLTSGVLAEDFFSVPSPEDYVVLGHAHRHLAGDLVAAAPHSDTAEMGDRVYTVYIRAIVEHNLAGLSNMLREYFLLSGIETESESALQHKVHRMRRELDPETPLLTAPVYCTTCFNRDHDTQEQCAEFQYKVHRRAAHGDAAAALTMATDNAAATPALSGRSVSRTLGQSDSQGSQLQEVSDKSVMNAVTVRGQAGPSMRTVRMRWRLRRRNEEQRWGVHLTKSLQLVGLENVQLIREGAIWSTAAEVRPEAGVGWSGDNGQTLPSATHSSPWPDAWLAEAASSDRSHNNKLPLRPADVDADAASEGQALRTSPSSGVIAFLHALFQGPSATADDSLKRNATPSMEALHDHLLQSPVLPLPTDAAAALQLHVKETPDKKSSSNAASAAAPTTSPATVAAKTVMVGPAALKACPWTLISVDATPVTTQRDVAAALLNHTGKSREVWLTFEVQVPENAAATAAAGAGHEGEASQTHDWKAGGEVLEGMKSGGFSSLPEALLRTTHAADRIPQSTAALPARERFVAETAMRDAVQATSPATQRWLQDLPYRLTLVLTKHRRHLRKHRSWGLQLDGTDMTLVNFARLMVQYMYASTSPDKRLRVEQAIVSSLTPAASFPRGDQAMTARLFEEVLPRLEPLLNDMYRVVRINTSPVRQKAEAARAMAAFQASLDAQLELGDASTHADVAATGNEAKDNSNNFFYLTLTLERKGSSYRMCTAAETDPTALHPAAAPTTPKPSRFTRQRPDDVSDKMITAQHDEREAHDGRGGAAAGKAAVPAQPSMEVDADLLDGVATSQCPVRPYTPAQLSRSCVTVAINRLLLTEQTRNKWGLRLQPGTRRLKAVQQNRQFSFHVFAAKQSQGTRIADTLRLVSTRRTAAPQPHIAPASPANSTNVKDADDSVSGPAVGDAPHVITRSFYLYFVERVNQHTVRHHDELRAELFAAAQPSSSSATLSPSMLNGSGAAPPLAITALPPESVTLTVRQFPLLRFAATVRRGGLGEGSALAPVGLQVDKNMCVLAVFAESPMARALEAAVGPLCSARRLVKARGSADQADNKNSNGSRRSSKNVDDAGVEEEEETTESTLSAASSEERNVSLTTASSSLSGEAVWEAVALPQLRTRIATVEKALLAQITPDGTHQPKKKQQVQRQWAYDLDEDEVPDRVTAVTAMEEKSTSRASGSATAEASQEGQTQTGSDSVAVAALRDLADVAAHTQQQLGRCTMVDGVHVLQASLLQEFALAQLAAQEKTNAPPDDVAAALRVLQRQLSNVYSLVRWEVVYAAQSHRSLRTPADLAAAFAPGVAEETVVIQQYVED